MGRKRTRPQLDDTTAAPEPQGLGTRRAIDPYKPETSKELSGLGAIQCTVPEVAAFFDVNERTIYRLFRDFPHLSEAFERGKGKGLIALRRAQFRLAMTNPIVHIWTAKQFLGQRDVQTVDARINVSRDAADLTDDELLVIALSASSDEERANRLPGEEDVVH